MPTIALAPNILTEEEEWLIDKFYRDLDRFVLSDTDFPECPQGGKCDCPTTKDLLGLRDHNCDPNPSSKCVVVEIVFKKGLRM